MLLHGGGAAVPGAIHLAPSTIRICPSNTRKKRAVPLPEAGEEYAR